MASATATTTTPAAAAPALTLRLVVDGRRVLFAEAGEDAVAFLSSLLTTPVRDAVDLLLQEDSPSAAAGCFSNLSAAVVLPSAAASFPSSLAPPPASPVSASRPPAAGRGIMCKRLFRCDGLGCRCSDAASRVPGSACPCNCHAGGGAARGTELHFLEASFYRRPDGSAASSTRVAGAGRGGDTFYRCQARGLRSGRDFFQCRYRVTDERGVKCPLCRSTTTVVVKLARGGDDEDGSSTRPGGAVVMEDLSVRPMADGMSRAALLAELGVADPAAVREEVVPFGFKQTVLTEVFLRTTAGDAPRRRRRCGLAPKLQG